ncbi:ankyrin repeat domain-containing protein [Streptomyces sp. NBC_01257]|uniref:ankyrin repeat domain-containing protein n=1 Tax=Streptomyces sp. NBC_01257 TaxID=2903799 RepID=UPI002DDAF107|nr:ankyrin repeat domain-containing protein [Streptomyces sp. NBC_01257]WRZ64280.1 ankyrin repeat domain-containing protein [Streptomyces sp. NBC_01257]
MTEDPMAAAAGGHRLFDALYEGENAVVRLLRSGVSAESVDEDGASALYLAAVSDRPGVVRLLLAAGADPDRACGPEAGDLPLCGAACGGHTEVAEALLAAGARPDLREQFGFTALRWAVGLGHARTAEVLLAYGADPCLPGPEGESPLLLAARRGSLPTVRALLRHGAGAVEGAVEEALGEARRMLNTDLEQEMRAGLRELYGDAYDVVVRRTVVDDGETLTVELVREGRPAAGRDQQTGHGAIATVLEAELGVRASFEELARRALRSGGPGLDNWQASAGALCGRGDEETRQAAAAWCASGEPLLREFGAEVLAGLDARLPGTLPPDAGSSVTGEA